jgi:hypothetical protein
MFKELSGSLVSDCVPSNNTSENQDISVLTWESMEKRKQRTHTTSKYLVQYMCRACCGVRGCRISLEHDKVSQKEWMGSRHEFISKAWYLEGKHFQVVQPIGPLFGSEAIGKQMPCPPTFGPRGRASRLYYDLVVDTASQITFLGEVIIIKRTCGEFTKSKGIPSDRK